MYYVYVLESVDFLGQKYIGYTSDLKVRIIQHNSGKCQHTSKYKPWKLLLYIAFQEQSKAIEFEKYLKTASGKAFLQKRLLSEVPLVR